MASTYLTRTPSSTGNRRKFTFSAWVKFKFNQLANNSRIFSCGSATSAWVSAYINSNATLQLAIVEGGNTYDILTNRLFRDENAWYHLVFVVDTGNATADNRLRMYVNGEEETSFSQRNNPTQDLDTQANTASKPIDIGSAENVGYSPRYFPGIMSHVHMTDGYVYSASDFGSTDTVTGEWKINTGPNVNYGTNGFFILKDGNSVTDQSGNSNNFTVGGGTLTKSEDNPSNVFAVFNGLSNADATLTNGNTSCLTNSGSYADRPVMTSLGMTKGKYYCEIKAGTVNTGATWEYGIVGITGRPLQYVTGSEQYQHLGSLTQHFGYYAYNGHLLNNSGSANTDTAYGNSWTTNDIIGIAVDIDNSKLYFSKNGVWQNSGDPTSGATGTGAISIDAVSSTIMGAYFFAVGAYHYTPRYNFHANFGNGYFATTAVSSAGTNASNNGIFEYDVPSGYTALSTKGINSF